MQDVRTQRVTEKISQAVSTKESEENLMRYGHGQGYKHSGLLARPSTVAITSRTISKGMPTPCKIKQPITTKPEAGPTDDAVTHMQARIFARLARLTTSQGI